ncbi:MAG: asparagine synthase (glutamine-hydrolyzing) [Saprospiraceae bacterium]
MCGIAGIRTYKSNQNLNLERDIKRMTNIMSHRGPDDEGFCISENNVVLGHRRLSIVDLSPTGHQPMNTDDGRYALVLNGEIYNHEELKVELVALGYKYKGLSDTETVLYGYAEWGDAIFNRLNGIFAIAIYDRKTEVLTLARDRFGVKPLYIAKGAQGWIFASEIKSILEVDTFNNVNKRSLHEFLFYGYPMKERTMFEGISKVLQGQVLKILPSGESTTSLFWKPEDIKLSTSNISEEYAIDQTRSLLESAVKRQLMSDVPVGVFLSGGIDSGAMTAFGSKHYGGRLKTFSAGFDFGDAGHNELPMAARVAKKFNTEHHEMMIKGGDLPDIIEKLVWHHDAPFSDAANIPLYLMTQQVKDSVKVILQGDGGDELYAGYQRYHLAYHHRKYKFITSALHPIQSYVPNNKLRDQIKRFYPIFNQNNEGNRFGRLLTMETPENSPLNILDNNVRKDIEKYDPYQYFGEIADRFSNIKTQAQKLLWLDTQIILPDLFLEKVDKSTMANSIEVRVPFLDNELSAFAMGLPAKLKLKKGVKKYILKKSLEGILPNEVLYGPKKGFGVPYENWTRGPLFTFMHDHIISFIDKNPGLLNKKILASMMHEHNNGIGSHGRILWKVLNLVLWMEKYNIKYN